MCGAQYTYQGQGHVIYDLGLASISYQSFGLGMQQSAVALAGDTKALDVGTFTARFLSRTYSKEPPPKARVSARHCHVAVSGIVVVLRSVFLGVTFAAARKYESGVPLHKQPGDAPPENSAHQEGQCQNLNEAKGVAPTSRPQPVMLISNSSELLSNAWKPRGNYTPDRCAQLARLEVSVHPASPEEQPLQPLFTSWAVPSLFTHIQRPDSTAPSCAWTDDLSKSQQIPNFNNPEVLYHVKGLPASPKRSLADFLALHSDRRQLSGHSGQRPLRPS